MIFIFMIVKKKIDIFNQFIKNIACICDGTKTSLITL